MCSSTERLKSQGCVIQTYFFKYIMIKWIKSLFFKEYVGYRPAWLKQSLKKQ